MLSVHPYRGHGLSFKLSLLDDIGGNKPFYILLRGVTCLVNGLLHHLFGIASIMVYTMQLVIFNSSGIFLLLINFT